MSDCVRRFLFEGLDIRGAFVQLGKSWQQMQAGRNYPEAVAGLLGELTAVTALIAGQLKQPGRLTFQLRGEGPVQLLVVDCDESLRLRGMARSLPGVQAAPVPELLGVAQGGQLMLTLDMASARQPWQSFVPLVGNSIAEIFQHYLEQSEQQASRLFTTAGPQGAACLFLQKLPQADARDADGWSRVSQLAATASPGELLDLDAESLLSRLFQEDMAERGIRIYDPLPVQYHCPENREKIADMLLGLGREEAEALLAEHGEILIRDDICNRDYRFTPADIATLFSSRKCH